MLDFVTMYKYSRPSIAMVALMLLVSSNGVYAATEEDVEAPGTVKAEYVRFSPDFVVNLKSTEPHFLMVTVQGMSRGPEGMLVAKHHMPARRHHLLMLLSEQTHESLTSVESKQPLMQAALVKIQELLVAETGKPGIEAVFFTDFVVE
jgi:flagellar FliL protein